MQPLEKEPKLVLRPASSSVGKRAGTACRAPTGKNFGSRRSADRNAGMNEWRMGYGNFCRRKSNDEVHDCAVVIGAAER